jgi:hypothetical protein
MALSPARDILMKAISRRRVQEFFFSGPLGVSPNYTLQPTTLTPRWSRRATRAVHAARLAWLSFWLT